jgi:hypothetical protein
MADFSELVGKTLTDARQEGDQLVFVTEDGETYRMFHSQDCCESVFIESIVGDLADLIGSPIVKAEEASNSEDPPRVDPDFPSYVDESYTWTFYKLATAKGYVDIRWYGSSNGYYSEGVDFKRDGEKEWWE